MKKANLNHVENPEIQEVQLVHAMQIDQADQPTTSADPFQELFVGVIGWKGIAEFSRIN